MTDPQPKSNDPNQPQADRPQPQDPPTDPALAAALADAEKWKNLSRQHETRSKANADKAIRFDQLEAEHAEALAKLTGERDTLTGEVAELRLAQMRRDAADTAGLTADLVQFITATTEAEAKKQAETLAAKLPAPGHDQGVRPVAKPDPGSGVSRLRAAYADRDQTR